MGDQLFKFTGKFRCLEVKDLPQEFPIKNCSTDMKFLVDKTGERHLKYRGHVYFEPIRPQINYQAAYLTYLKSHNNSYENISIAKGL